MRNTSLLPSSTHFTKNYFSIIKELKQNNIHNQIQTEPKKPLTKFTEEIYTKYSNNIESYIKKNKNKIQFRATTKYDNISIDSFLSELQSYKQVILNKIKDNPSLIPNMNEEVPEEEIILTPLPEKYQTQSQCSSRLNDELEKNDYHSAKRTAVVMRIVEYTHRFKRENMHPKKNIFNKNNKVSKRQGDENNRAVFMVMKNAIDTIEKWWIKRKEKPKVNKENFDIEKYIYDNNKVIYIQKWFKKKKIKKKQVDKTLIKKPVIVKSYIVKMTFNLYNLIMLQNAIRIYLRRKQMQRHTQSNKIIYKRKTGRDTLSHFNLIKPLLIIKIRPTLIHKEIQYKPSLYIDSNNVVSFMEKRESSINLESYVTSQRESIISSYFRQADNIQFLSLIITKISYRSFIKSLNEKRILNIIRKAILKQNYSNWKAKSKIDSYSASIQRNKPKTYAHSFVYKSKKFKSKPNYLLFQLLKGLLAISNTLHYYPFQKIKQHSKSKKLMLFNNLVTKKHKKNLYSKLLLNSLKIIDNSQVVTNQIHTKISNENNKEQLMTDNILEEGNAFTEESDDEIIEQDDDNDNENNSDDTLTEKESYNENNDDNHINSRVIPQAVKDILISKTQKPHVKSKLNNTELALNTSNDTTITQSNVNDFLSRNQRQHINKQSKSVDRLRFVLNKNTPSRNVIIIRDSKSIDYISNI